MQYSFKQPMLNSHIISHKTCTYSNMVHINMVHVYGIRDCSTSVYERHVAWNEHVTATLISVLCYVHNVCIFYEAFVIHAYKPGIISLYYQLLGDRNMLQKSQLLIG